MTRVSRLYSVPNSLLLAFARRRPAGFFRGQDPDPVDVAFLVLGVVDGEFTPAQHDRYFARVVFILDPGAGRQLARLAVQRDGRVIAQRQRAALGDLRERAVEGV